MDTSQPSKWRRYHFPCLDLDAAIQFFAELGLVPEGRMQVEGDWVDRVVGLTGIRSEIAMMRTPDGHSRLELTRYHAPAAVTVQTKNPPAHTLGLHRIMFAVEDIDGVLARLRKHGAELFGEVAQYEQMCRLCYLRGPRASSSHWHSGLGETVTLSFPRKRFLDDSVAHDTTMQAPTRVWAERFTRRLRARSWLARKFASAHVRKK
jgi:catechol 2,3-dioxygenase-like lactoylglutathione lyase family enzyme